MRSIAIVGAGGFGREVIDSCAGPWQLVDDNRAGERVRGAVVLERTQLPSRTAYVVAVADPRLRERLARELAESGHAPGTILDSSAVVGADCAVSPGCIIRSHVSITTAVHLGMHVHVNINATIGHDSTLEDYVTVMPGAHISGNVAVGRGSTVGTGAVILPGITVGANVRVGAGAVVTADVPNDLTVVGVPARSL